MDFSAVSQMLPTGDWITSTSLTQAISRFVNDIVHVVPIH